MFWLKSHLLRALSHIYIFFVWFGWLSFTSRNNKISIVNVREKILMTKFTNIASIAAVAFVFLMNGVAASNQYVAPGLTETLAASSQAYLIGISSTVLFLICTLMAVMALTGIDYSNDSLLTVDVEPTADEQ
jgi:hypothetical protein